MGYSDTHCIIELFQSGDGKKPMEVHAVFYEELHEVHSIHH